METLKLYSIGVACLNTNRKYIGVEKKYHFFNKVLNYLKGFIKCRINYKT